MYKEKVTPCVRHGFGSLFTFLYPPPVPVPSFVLTATNSWWSDERYGPLANYGACSWLRAFPLLAAIRFSDDGEVTITPRDEHAAAWEQAPRRQEALRKVTRKLQYLRCNVCGSNVALRGKACCDRQQHVHHQLVSHAWRTC